jgi:hypothetical protein
MHNAEDRDWPHPPMVSGRERTEGEEEAGLVEPAQPEAGLDASQRYRAFLTPPFSHPGSRYEPSPAAPAPERLKEEEPWAAPDRKAEAEWEEPFALDAAAEVDAPAGVDASTGSDETLALDAAPAESDEAPALGAAADPHREPVSDLELEAVAEPEPVSELDAAFDTDQALVSDDRTSVEEPHEEWEPEPSREAVTQDEQAEEEHLLDLEGVVGPGGGIRLVEGSSWEDAEPSPAEGSAETSAAASEAKAAAEPVKALTSGDARARTVPQSVEEVADLLERMAGELREAGELAFDPEGDSPRLEHLLRGVVAGYLAHLEDG